MSNQIASNHPDQNSPRLAVSSYDSGYEFSVDRYAGVKLLVQAAEDNIDTPATYASAH